MPTWSYTITTSDPAGVSASPITSLAGTTIKAPFRRAENDVATVRGIDAIKGALAQILGTRAGTRYLTGELPWRTDFGSLLHLLRHKPNDAITAELARIYVVQAIRRWEPRVLVKKVDISAEKKDVPSIERPILLIKVTFDIRTESGSLIARDEVVEVSG